MIDKILEIALEILLFFRRKRKGKRTKGQVHSMHVLVLTLLRDYPGCRVCGHRDLSPDLNGNGEIEPEEWVKACPCFDAEEEWA